MPDLNKTRTLPVRFSQEQLDRLAKACEAEKNRLGETVKPTRLVREATMEKVHRILGQESEPAESTAQRSVA